MKSGTLTHIKTKRLKLRLKIPLYQAGGILETMWQVTAESADDGVIGRLSNEEIAACLEWERDPDELVSALEHCRWLDRNPDGLLVVHDWMDHCPGYIHRRREAGITEHRGLPSQSKKAQGKRRRERIAAVRHDFTEQQWLDILDYFNGCCAYCLRKLRRLAQDHMTPVCRGGEHTAENIVPTCRRCNSRKGRKTLIEFAGRYGTLQKD